MVVGCGKNVRVMALAALILTQLVVACGGGSGGGDITKPTPVVTQLALTPGAATIVSGQQATIAAQPKDATGNPVNGLAIGWSIGDPSIATVSSGVVTAIKPGQTTITATAGSVSNTATITVIPAVASVNVTPSTWTLAVNGTRELTATLLDANGATIAQGGTRTVAWSSSNDAIASVSSAGVVTAKALGSVTITASIEGKSGTATVDVKAPVVASVVVSATTVRVGESKQLQATLTDANGQTATGRSITWSTSDASKVSVSPTGVVKGEAVGSATITATSEGKSGSATVNVVAQGAPILGTPSVSPVSVDVRTSAQTVTISGQASDGSGTGLRSVQVTAKGHTSSTTHADPTATCTTTTFGTGGAWSCTLGIPVGAAAGQWPIVSATVTDNTGAATTYGATELGAAKFTVTSDEDLVEPTGPANICVSVSPSTACSGQVVVDVSNASATIDVATDYGDNLSGVASFTYRLASVNDPKMTVECTGHRLSGTPTAGRWGCSVTIPKGATPGFWTQTFIALDGAFNESNHTIGAFIRVDRTP